MSSTDRRVLMIGLDAAEPRLIERWSQDGTLPNLGRLRENGVYGRLHSTADWLVGSPWPSFFTSTPPADHGFYHVLTWDPERMTTTRPSPARLPIEPFWRRWDSRGPRTIAVDVPLVYAPRRIHGLEVAGYATHDGLVPPTSQPRGLLRRLRREIGPVPRTEEHFGPMPLAELLAESEQQQLCTRRVTELTIRLMRRERWNLTLVGLSAAHRAGHKLWDATGCAEPLDGEGKAALHAALRAVYAGVDEAVGRLIRAAGEGTTVMVFSLHGMGPNTCRVDLLPQMLERVLANPVEADAQTASGALQRMREKVPNRWRHAVKSQLPLGLQDRLTVFWCMGGTDWSRTAAVSLVADLQGYIRLNLRGRERDGIVEPGSDAAALCERITTGLREFVDADTGEPVVDRIEPIEVLEPTGGRRELLPDLIVRWSPTPAARHRLLRSRRFGDLPWPTPGRHPSGRSGNHRPEGFMLASGGPFKAGDAVVGGHILDLAPTAHALLDVRLPETMRGRVLA